MEQHRFRPRVDGLEDRVVPAVSATEVVAAYTRTVETTEELRGLSESLGRPRTAEGIQRLATNLPVVAAQSRADAAVLSEFLVELRARVAADPAVARTHGQFLGGFGVAVFEATVNAAFADLFARGFGAPPPSPPPPPPPRDTPPNFGVDTSTPPAGTGTNTGSPGSPSTTPPVTVPPGGLPFSLTDSNFRTLSGGVKVWDVQEGTGAAVTAGSKITADYTGYLTDGTEFDSSLDRNQPLSTTLDAEHLIQGWVDGIAGMKVGGTRRLVIPAALAYGSQGRTGIPPNSDLVFEVKLISVA